MILPEKGQLYQLPLKQVRHNSLPPYLLEQIKRIYDVFSPQIDMTLEQFEIGFMRDVKPEVEVAIWLQITAAWQDYHKALCDGADLPRVEALTLLIGLIAISAGNHDLSSLNLPVEVWAKLLKCYYEASACDGSEKEIHDTSQSLSLSLRLQFKAGPAPQ